MSLIALFFVACLIIVFVLLLQGRIDPVAAIAACLLVVVIWYIVAGAPDLRLRP